MQVTKKQQNKSNCLFDSMYWDEDAVSLMGKLVNSLPTSPCSEDGTSYPAWTDGDMIFCRSEEAANFLADLIEMVDKINYCTGYYNPKEDKKSGTVDRCTSWWYIDVS